MSQLDAVVIGGGPAGSTAARLLAQWGHQVAILAAPPARRALAECLPPSTKKVFRFLGIEDAIAAAGFLETRGNTVWWGPRGRRVEPYPEGAGYQVARGEFDRVLLGLARQAGAEVRVGRAFAAEIPRLEFHAAGRRVPVCARFVLDCSGRAGVLARQFRVKPRGITTVALCGVWRSERGWKMPDASHTLVESYGDGWAWSIPLSATVRHVAFMVDPAHSGQVRGSGVAAAYAAQMAKTRALRRIFSRSELAGSPWGRDASLYSSTQFGGPGFVLAGDAGSFIDPLSSFGVKKAMVSGWAAAVVANTCLASPQMQDAALQFFGERERAIESSYRRQAGSWFQEGEGPFWTARAETIPAEGERELAQAALDQLKRRGSIGLRRGNAVQEVRRAEIEGREVVLRPALLAPGWAEPVDYLWNIDAVKLVEIAPAYRTVPDLFDAYCRVRGPADLADFLRALATAVAKGLLISL